MDDLDDRIANAINAVQNQKPIPVPKSFKKSKKSEKEDETFDLLDFTDHESKPTEVKVLQNRTPENGNEVSQGDKVSVKQENGGKEPENEPAHAKPLQSQAPNSTDSKGGDRKPKAKKVAVKQVEGPVDRERRPSLIDDMEVETVSFQSTYLSRHISPAGKSSRTSPLQGPGSAAAAAAATGSSTATKGIALNLGPGADENEQPRVLKYNHLSADFQLGDGQQGNLVDSYGHHISAEEAAEIISQDAYKRRIGEAITQDLLERIGALPEAKPWSLDRADAPSSIARDAYVPNYRTGGAHKTDDMKVMLRVRPMFSSEKKAGAKRCVSLCGLQAKSEPGVELSEVHRNAHLVLVNPSVPVFEVDELAQAVDADASFSKDIATVYNFDSCLWSASNNVRNAPAVNADQSVVYKAVGDKIAKAALEGVSSVCFAYGEEKSGKTYTMFGGYPRETGSSTNSLSDLVDKSNEHRGILPRVYTEIIENMNHEDTKCTLSIVEIYMEKIHDLLGSANTGQGDVHAAVKTAHISNGSKGSTGPIHHYERQNSLLYRSTHARKSNVRLELKVREHPLLGPYVDGMKKVRVRTPDDMIAIVREAQAERIYLHEQLGTIQHHGTVLATLELTPLHDVGSHAKSRGGLQHSQKAVRVQMVDLAAAPSESVSNWRTSVKTSSKATLGNQKVINITMNGNSSVPTVKQADEVKVVRKMLSHLNYILHSMERGAQMHALPFRDTSLTWLLRSTLVVPHSHISLIANIAPGDRSFEETTKTLKYAERLCLARDLRGRVQRNKTEERKWEGPSANNLSTDTPYRANQKPKPAFNTSMKTYQKDNVLHSGAKQSFQRKGVQVSTPTTSLTPKVHAAPSHDKDVGQADSTEQKQEPDTALATARVERDALLASLPPPHSPSANGEASKAPALVEKCDDDSQEVVSLKTTIVSLQRALEQSLTEKNVLRAENDALRARCSSGTTAADFTLSCTERADGWRARAEADANDAASAELQAARADVIAAHEALASFQLEAQNQLQSLWTAVQELNKLDKQKEDAIAQMIIERGKTMTQLRQAKARERELEQELQLYDDALIAAANEVGSQEVAVKANSPQSKFQPKRERETVEQAAVPASPDAFTYKISDDADSPTATEANTVQGAAREEITNAAGSGGATSSVTRPFNNSDIESGDDENPTKRNTGAFAYDNYGVESMAEDELDAQIEKLSKFLVKDRALIKQQQLRSSRTP